MVREINKYKKLLNNSIIFAIANLGSKLITLLMVPLYTYTLSKAEYGVADLSTNLINMLLPVVSLSIYDAVLRYVMDKKQDRNSILTNGLFVLVIPLGIMLGTAIVMRDKLYFYMVLVIILQSVQALFTQFIRAIDKLKLFAFNGIFLAVLVFLLNILFLKILRQGISGYFLSIIIATLISNSFLFFAAKIYTTIQIKKIDFETIKMMLFYSLPLIPNALMWWLINSSNRYFILLDYGAAENGLFAVASKIPSVINIIYSIFFQAWQLVAIEEFEKKDSNTFYSEVFTLLSAIMFMSTSFIIIILIPLMEKIVEKSYFISWKYVPFLLLSVVFASFAGFLGTNYIALKNTRGVFTSSLIAGIINIVLSFTFLKVLPPFYVGLASAISFFAMFIIRYVETKALVQIQINFYKLFLSVGIILAQIVLLFVYGANAWLYNILISLLYSLIYRSDAAHLVEAVKKYK